MVSFPLKDSIIRAFSAIPEHISPSEALLRLGGQHYGIISHTQQRSYIIITKDDLHKLQERNIAIISEGYLYISEARMFPADITPEAIAQAFQERAADFEPHGAVIIQDRAIQGIISLKAIRYLAERYRQESAPERDLPNQLAIMPQHYISKLTLDTQILANDPKLPDPVRIKCDTCGHINNIYFYDPDRPPRCQICKRTITDEDE